MLTCPFLEVIKSVQRKLQLFSKVPCELWFHLTVYVHMWLSRVEIEHYFVVYFDRVTAFDML